MHYSAQDKMCDLIAAEYTALQIISRFGLPLGVGDKTIQEVCEEHHVHTLTFLAVVNYKIGDPLESIPFDQLSLKTIVDYLRNAHSYFFDFSLPMIRKKLIEAMNYTGEESDEAGDTTIDEMMEQARGEVAAETGAVATGAASATPGPSAV